MAPLGMTDLDLLERMFGQLPDCPFFVKDRDLHYVAANAAMARLCGVRRPGDLYGDGARRFFPERLAHRYEALDRQVLASGRAITNKLELSVGKADSAWLLYSRFPVRAADGTTVGIAAVARRLKPVGGTDPVYGRVARVAEHLQAHLDEPLRLDALAVMAGTSKSQLERDFMRLFALTPGAFLQQVRLERALQLLETGMSVARVAYECGYADHSAFTRRFREAVGASPREYRAHLAGRPEQDSKRGTRV